jgi:hypothetical protein
VLSGVVGHGLGGDAHRAQLGGDEELDALGVERAAVLLAHPPGDLLHAAVPVEVRRDDEEQARHVQHLLVGSHDEVVRLGEPRALVLAEQRDARRERGRQECGVGHRRRVLRAGVEVASRFGYAWGSGVGAHHASGGRAISRTARPPPWCVR